MRIVWRSDGSVALDWEPPAGPFVVLTVAQYKELVKAVKAREGLY